MQEKLHVVPKGWGFEKWIVNNEKYCGKILYFVKDRKCSFHYHKLKTETFYIQSGKIILRYSELNKLDKTEIILLKSDVETAFESD